jgi:phage shock protein PspC (stress-responsive transcriptional regulator)
MSSAICIFEFHLNNKIMILGVSGWLGNKIGMQEKHVRIIFILAALFAGVGVGVYLILWVIKLLTK